MTPIMMNENRDWIPMCCFQKDCHWTETMDSFLYTNTHTCVTHDPSRPVRWQCAIAHFGPTGLSESSLTRFSRTVSWTSQLLPAPAINNHFQQRTSKLHTLPLAPAPQGPTMPVALLKVWLGCTFSAQCPALGSSSELVLVAHLPAWIPVLFDPGRGVIPSPGFLERDTRISTLAWWNF